MFYLRGNKCYLHTLTNVHNDWRTARVNMDISTSAIKSTECTRVQLNRSGFHNHCGPWLMSVTRINYFLNTRWKYILSIM